MVAMPEWAGPKACGWTRNHRDCEQGSCLTNPHLYSYAPCPLAMPIASAPDGEQRRQETTDMAFLTLIQSLD